MSDETRPVTVPAGHPRAESPTKLTRSSNALCRLPGSWPTPTAVETEDEMLIFGVRLSTSSAGRCSMSTGRRGGSPALVGRRGHVMSADDDAIAEYVRLIAMEHLRDSGHSDQTDAAWDVDVAAVRELPEADWDSAIREQVDAMLGL
jgi:hypothetical protein